MGCQLLVQDFFPPTLHRIGVVLALLALAMYCSDLGRVDGFNQDEAECKGYEGSVVLRGLLASECDAFEALEFADGLLDACPRPGSRLICMG